MRTLIIIAALFMASCATQNRCASKFPVKESRVDSIIYKERIIKVPSPVKPKVIIRKDSILIRDTVNCPNEDKKGSSVKGNTRVDWSIKNNRLIVESNNLSDTVEAQRLLIDSLKVEVAESEHYTTIVKVVTVENQSLKKDVKYLKKMLWLWVVISLILGFGHIARSYNKLRERFKFLP